MLVEIHHQGNAMLQEITHGLTNPVLPKVEIIRNRLFSVLSQPVKDVFEKQLAQELSGTCPKPKLLTALCAPKELKQLIGELKKKGIVLKANTLKAIQAAQKEVEKNISFVSKESSRASFHQGTEGTRITFQEIEAPGFGVLAKSTHQGQAAFTFEAKGLTSGEKLVQRDLEKGSETRWHSWQESIHKNQPATKQLLKVDEAGVLLEARQRKFPQGRTQLTQIKTFPSGEKQFIFQCQGSQAGRVRTRVYQVSPEGTSRLVEKRVDSLVSKAGGEELKPVDIPLKPPKPLW